MGERCEDLPGLSKVVSNKMIEFCGESIYCEGEVPVQIGVDPGPGRVLSKPIFVVNREMYDAMVTALSLGALRRMAELLSNMPEKMPERS